METQRRTHTHRHCTVIHHRLAHSYPIGIVPLAVELHTNTSHFVLGGRAVATIPTASPLILTLFSEWEREPVARCSGLVINRREYLQAATELWLSRSWQHTDRHRKQIWDGLITQRKEGAACQDKNINDTAWERRTERWTSCKIHSFKLGKGLVGGKLWFKFHRVAFYCSSWLCFSCKGLHKCRTPVEMTPSPTLEVRKSAKIWSARPGKDVKWRLVKALLSLSINSTTSTRRSASIRSHPCSDSASWSTSN